MPTHMRGAAVVTGHSRGIGAGIAERLLERDIAVLGIARTGNKALAARFGDLLQETQLDLSDLAAVARWVTDGALRKWMAGGSGSAFLVNNAGLLEPIGPLETQDVAAVARAVAVNVAAPLMLSAAFVTATADVRDRRIVHISSGAARRAYAGWAVYCATKAALDHHARAVALDETRGLRISSLAPGVVDTDMQTEIRATTLKKFPERGRFEQLQRRGELQEPPEVATRLVRYLLDDTFGDEPVVELGVLAGFERT